jgi:hypothetical protein
MVIVSGGMSRAIFSAGLQVAHMSAAEDAPMNATSRTYELGRAGDLDRERPTVADLQRAQIHALRRGDRRRAAAYALVVNRRIEIAQRDAAAAHAAEARKAA